MRHLHEQYDYDLKQVSWGYRDRFKDMIYHLLDNGFIGLDNRENTEFFFDFLRKQTDTLWDSLANNYLESLVSSHSWILRNPHLFKLWASTGEQLAAIKHYAGALFFEISKSGGLGHTPAQVTKVLTHINVLMENKLDLALGLIRNYHNLIQQLDLPQIDVFVQEAESVFQGSVRAGCEFIEGKLESSDVYIRRITRESRLSDVTESLQRIIQAIAGKQVTVDHLGKLDSDELLERGSRVVGFSKWLYLPLRIAEFSTQDLNGRLYHLMAVVCGCGHLFKGFVTGHAEPGCGSLEEYLRGAGFADGVLEQASTLVELCEYYRITQAMRTIFPGCVRMLDWGIRIEFEKNQGYGASDLLLQAVLLNQVDGDNTVMHLIQQTAERSSTWAETVVLVRELFESKAIEISSLPHSLRRIVFWPDPQFPAEVSVSPLNNTAVNLNDPDNNQAGKVDGEKGEAAEAPQMDNDEAADGTGEGSDKDGPEPVKTGYFYNEWNGLRGEYYRNWCLLHEKRPPGYPDRFSDCAYGQGDEQRIRSIFERIKPDTIRKQKNLNSGDSINIDRLIDYITLKKARIIGKEDFYEKPIVRERDLAVMILVDISGSTGSIVVDRLKVLDLEKKAAALLGDGLELLGDRFAVCGFTGSGRENCEFAVFKDFDDSWDQNTRASLFGIGPGTSTRIGVAVRHAGTKLCSTTARRKLLLLVTDGEPMDNEYDHRNGYAYMDIRKACGENLEQGVDTFAVITDDKHRDVFLQMFPKNNFIVIKDIRDLPTRMSRFFVSLTA